MPRVKSRAGKSEMILKLISSKVVEFLQIIKAKFGIKYFKGCTPQGVLLALKKMLTDKGIWFNNSFLHHEQLLDEAKGDMKNYADLGTCYPPKPNVSRHFPRV